MDVVYLSPPSAKRPAATPLPVELKTTAAQHLDKPEYLVGLALYAEINRYEVHQFPFDNQITKQLGITARQKSQGLKKLERAGVIRVFHCNGCPPEVLIEKEHWFEQLPHFVGAVSISKLAGLGGVQNVPNATTESGAINIGVQSGRPIPFPPETFEPVTVSGAFALYRAHRQQQARSTLRRWKEEQIWLDFMVCLKVVAAEKSTFALSPTELRDAMGSFCVQRTENKDVAAVLVELGCAFVWLEMEGFLTPTQANRLIACRTEMHFERLPRPRRSAIRQHDC